MSKEYACATDSQSKHIYGRDNQNSDKKGLKMATNGKILARIALKWQGHGTGGIFLSMSMGNGVCERGQPLSLSSNTVVS